MTDWKTRLEAVKSDVVQNIFKSMIASGFASKPRPRSKKECITKLVDIIAASPRCVSIVETGLVITGDSPGLVQTLLLVDKIPEDPEDVDWTDMGASTRFLSQKKFTKSILQSVCEQTSTDPCFESTKKGLVLELAQIFRDDPTNIGLLSVKKPPSGKKKPRKMTLVDKFPNLKLYIPQIAVEKHSCPLLDSMEETLRCQLYVETTTRMICSLPEKGRGAAVFGVLTKDLTSRPLTEDDIDIARQMHMNIHPLAVEKSKD